MKLSVSNTSKIGKPVKVFDANGTEIRDCLECDTVTGVITRFRRDSENRYMDDGEGSLQTETIQVDAPLRIESPDGVVWDTSLPDFDPSSQRLVAEIGLSNAPMLATTTNAASTNQVPNLDGLDRMGKWTREDREASERKFEEKSKGNPCALCGHVMRIRPEVIGRPIAVCSHVMAEMRRMIEQAHAFGAGEEQGLFHVRTGYVVFWGCVVVEDVPDAPRVEKGGE